MKKTKYLIDGIDRLGKSSLIARIQEAFGYHLVIHYDKPKNLECNESFAKSLKKSASEFLESNSEADLNELQNIQIKNVIETSDLSKWVYQEDTNQNMFELMKTKVPIIFDRTHLGEMVYAPMYRNYPGDYVFELEEDFVKGSAKKAKATVLVLLVTSNTEMLQDDGMSFDFKNKDLEQNRFIEAYNRSKLPKIMIDVHDMNGDYRDYEDIFYEFVEKCSQL